MITTLYEIRKNNPCNRGWCQLLRSLYKTKADHEPVSIEYIINSNGVDDAIWALRCIEGYDKEIYTFAITYIKRAQHLVKDQVIIDAINEIQKSPNVVVLRTIADKINEYLEELLKDSEFDTNAEYSVCRALAMLGDDEIRRSVYDVVSRIQDGLAIDSAQKTDAARYVDTMVYMRHKEEEVLTSLLLQVCKTKTIT